MIRISEKDRDRIIELLHGIDETETGSTDGWWETSAGAESGSKILQEIKLILSIPDRFNAPIKETYQCYDENDNFIGEKERSKMSVIRFMGSTSYPIDDGSGVYFSDSTKGLCVLSSRVAVWTLRHYVHKYFEEVSSDQIWGDEYFGVVERGE